MLNLWQKGISLHMKQTATTYGNLIIGFTYPRQIDNPSTAYNSVNLWPAAHVWARRAGVTRPGSHRTKRLRKKRNRWILAFLEVG